MNNYQKKKASTHANFLFFGGDYTTSIKRSLWVQILLDGGKNRVAAIHTEFSACTHRG